MGITCDAYKRQQTLDQRGLDFGDAAIILAAFHLTRIDDRRDNGEVLHIVPGSLRDRPVVMVWTLRDDTVRVISLRTADDDEREIHRRELERSG